MKTILAAVDFSPVTSAVLAEAAALVEPPDGRVILLHVTEPTALIIDLAIASMSVARVDEVRVTQARNLLARLERELLEKGVPAEVRHATGMPVPEIIAAAAAVGADGIVVGSHGHSTIHDLFVGSTTAGVVKRARCPIVVVPSLTHRDGNDSKADTVSRLWCTV
ncbi:MAG: universal stress protein [Opitutaceae bacterium]|nr:universal stress protein [Opitutaceae bacterium]